MTDPHQAATSPGTGQADLDRRAAIAEALGKEVWPADRDRLVARAQQSNASDDVLAQLHRLPEGRQFANVQDIAQTLGLGTEQGRF
jgi:hypothetical protein